MLTINAPAKVNLVLEVLGKLDNYHQISSIVQAVSLYDVLAFELSERMSFRCSEPALERDNLVVKAAFLLREAVGCRREARIDLSKHIPWGMGLGGGSSDAAAALLGLNALWELGLSPAELARLGSHLGSDVPFFIHGGMALVEGTGGKVTPLPSLPSLWFVLLVPALPKIPEKTKHLYGRLNSKHFTRGQFVSSALPCLQRGKFDLALAFNSFEGVVFDVFPGLREYRERFEGAGAPRVCLTGSGPGLFTILSEEERAGEIASRLREQGLECYVAPSCSGDTKDRAAL